MSRLRAARIRRRARALRKRRFPEHPSYDSGLNLFARPLAALAIFLVAGGALAFRDFRVRYFFQSARCTVLEKRISRIDVPDGGKWNTSHREYEPAILISYECDGSKVKVWCYDSHRSSYKYYTPAHDRLSRYEIGKTYTCWYDPWDSGDVVLTKEGTDSVYVALLIVVVGLLGVTPWLVSIYWKRAQGGPADVEGGERD